MKSEHSNFFNGEFENQPSPRVVRFGVRNEQIIQLKSEISKTDDPLLVKTLTLSMLTLQLQHWYDLYKLHKDQGEPDLQTAALKAIEEIQNKIVETAEGKFDD